MTDKNTPSQQQPAHFKGKDALGHVIEAQANGMISASEVHGTEIPGHLSAGCDSARETAILLAIIALILFTLSIPVSTTLALLAVASAAWALWKAGRSAWLGWFRLERLHRVLEQERWEIEHHRQQERDELRILYAAKGFEGKLLEDVLDVLMADNDRLLKVMIEEELGLTLETAEHPLKQGLGAFFGVFSAAALSLLLFWLLPPYGLIVGAAAVIAIASGISASLADNEIIPAVVWNLGIAILSLATLYFLMTWLITFNLQIPPA